MEGSPNCRIGAEDAAMARGKQERKEERKKERREGRKEGKQKGREVR
jgi:hypothetical protein